jgi:hypothetical protein
MKLKLNKKQLKNLSKDNKVLPLDMTPQVGAGANHQELTHFCSNTCDLSQERFRCFTTDFTQPEGTC